MSTRVRSYSKVNLGLAIGPVRGDGFHGLTTLYQTLELHDFVTVEARPASATAIVLTSNDQRVPTDSRNTCWKMVERALARMEVAAEVAIQIEKRLPVQGGMGAGSANAAAALIGLERELEVSLPGAERLELAGEVGSDVPLFLLGGAVLGLGRGELVVPLPDMSSVFCVVAVPEVGVSTPQAFRDWDTLQQGTDSGRVRGLVEEEAFCKPTYGDEAARYGAPGSSEGGGSAVPCSLFPVSSKGLTLGGKSDRLMELSLALAAVYAEPGTSGIIRGSEAGHEDQRGFEQVQTGQWDDLAENALLSLVRTGVENDFERVVFPAYPSLREIKRQLMGESGSSGQALYAALSGSGSALFGLYRSEADAEEAQRRVLDAGRDAGTKAIVTRTLPRSAYWSRMFAG